LHGASRKSPRTLFLSLLLVALTTLLTVGCGSSSDSYVATNTGYAGPNNGDLVFEFTQPAAQSAEVPAGTTDLTFDFFNAANANVLSVDKPFATTVVVEDVPVSATRVVITTYGPGGIPLATIEAPVTVVGGSSVTVDLSGAIITPIAPPGQLIVEPSTLTFAPGGLIGAVDDIINLLAVGDPIDNVAFFRAYFIPEGETQRLDVTARVGVNFSNFYPATFGADSFTYINVAGEGLAITSNPLAPTPPFGGTATMTVTYIHDGLVYSDDVEISLENPSLVGVEFLSAQDGTLTLPASGATEFEVTSVALYSNGFRLPILDFDGAQFSPIPDTFTLAVQTPATGLNLVDGDIPNGALTTTGGGAGQTATLAVTANGDPTVLGTLEVNLIDATAVTEVALQVSPTALNPTASYTVTVTYNDAANTTEEITGNWFLVESFNGPGEVSPQGLLPSVGKLLGVVRGLTEVRIDDDLGTGTVTSFLNNAVGLAGSDSDANNNFVEVDVLSTVPLSLIGGFI